MFKNYHNDGYNIESKRSDKGFSVPVLSRAEIAKKIKEQIKKHNNK